MGDNEGFKVFVPARAVQYKAYGDYNAGLGRLSQTAICVPIALVRDGGRKPIKFQTGYGNVTTALEVLSHSHCTISVYTSVLRTWILRRSKLMRPSLEAFAEEMISEAQKYSIGDVVRCYGPGRWVLDSDVGTLLNRLENLKFDHNLEEIEAAVALLD